MVVGSRRAAGYGLLEWDQKKYDAGSRPHPLLKILECRSRLLVMTLDRFDPKSS